MSRGDLLRPVGLGRWLFRAPLHEACSNLRNAVFTRSKAITEGWAFVSFHQCVTTCGSLSRVTAGGVLRSFLNTEKM